MIEKLNEMRDFIKLYIKGQDPVIDLVCKRIEEAELGLTDPSRPKGSFIFLGPTGVGKTELCKLISTYLFGPKQLIRLDMSEYMLEKNVNNLIGDDTGYLGRLGEGLQNNTGKGGIILFDEMEKGHRRIVDICLQMLDDARITCGRNESFCLKDYYLIFTSNIGSHKIIKAASGRANISTSLLEKIVLSEFIKSDYRPEFLARFDKLVMFDFIKPAVARDIAELNLQMQCKRVGEQAKLDISYSPNLINTCLMNGYKRELGVRPMRNYVEGVIQRAVAEKILSGNDDSHLILN
ncbi:MAG: AAA family ATPase [Lentisphaeria bacterium]|nr:AAA family ATPase [Lentisphaeria bacterium]